MKIIKSIALFIVASILVALTSYALEYITGEKSTHSFRILLFAMLWLHAGVVDRIEKLKK